MSILNTIKYGPQPKLETRQAEPQLETRSQAITSLQLLINTIIEASGDITAIADSSVPAVYRGAQLYSSVTASLPLRSATKATGIVDAETPDILDNPNMDETYAETMASVVQSLYWRGNAFLLPMTYDKTGLAQSLIVANPDDVNVDWDHRQIFRTYSWRDKPMESGKEIIHISINRFPGEHSGLGPISAAARLMQGMKAEGNAARRLYEDDATPGGALKVKKHISKTEAEEILDIWETTHQGRKRPGVLGNDTEWQSITMSALDAQFLENRTFSVQEIARMIGVPGYFLLVPSGDGLTYSTTEGLFRLWLTMSLNPIYLEVIQQAFSRLLPKGRIARFDTSEILRADLLTRYQANQIGLDAGFLTVDEVRQGEGLSPLGVVS